MAGKRSRTVITSEKKLFDFNLKELFGYRDLVFLFVRRDFVANYKQTVLGPLWAIIQPLITTLVYTLVFGMLAGLSPQGFPPFLFYFPATIIWVYFGSCLNGVSNTFISNRQLLGKVYFPRLVLPVSTLLSKLVSFLIQFAILIVLTIIFTATGAISPNAFILLTPVVLLQLALLALGVGLIISALTTKYRDLIMLFGFGIELWKYATPVAYDMFSLSLIAPGGGLNTLYMLNPVTPLVNIFRYAFLGTGGIDWMFYLISWAVTLFLLLLGLTLFSRSERTFADTV